ncbi:MAG TPA: type VI secretion system tip protein TssI/VgrG [Nannocystis sp.]
MPDHPAPHQKHTLLPEARYTFEVSDQVADVHVVRVALYEILSEPYRLIVDLLCEDHEFSADDLLGADCRLTIARDESPARDVHGLVLRVEQRGRRDRRQALRLEIGPALALLAHQVDTRAWQQLSAPQIALDVLEDRLSALGRRVRLDLDTAAYTPREYCVQYRESDLDFVLRLLHDEGIAFRFDHDSHADSETLVLFDTNTRCPARAPVPFNRHETALSAEQSVERLERARQLGVTGVTQRDWIPLIAGESPHTYTRCARDDRRRERIVYDHDDRRIEADDAGTRARRKLDRMTVLRDACTGAGDVLEFTPGLRFELAGHPESARDRSYLLLSVEHHGAVPDADRLGDDLDAPRYTNSFTCVPDDVPFRPQLPERLRRPRVHGPHTAIVVGPEGEEIHTDEHGRIKLRFHWDRDSPADDRASCWVRVAQTWAGAGWGALFIPRVGMEVLVEFIDGDPDRPLVVGCVYNSHNTPPVALPDDKTCSALTSESSPGGGLANQIRLEDGRGRESLTLKTRRDLHTTAGHDHTATIAHDHTIKIGANQTRLIGANQVTTVQAHCDLTVADGDLTTTVLAGKQLTDIHGDQSTIVRAGNVQLEVECGNLRTRAHGMVQTTSTNANIHIKAHGALYAESETDDLILDAKHEVRAQSQTASLRLKAATDIQLTSDSDEIAARAHTNIKLSAMTGDVSATAAGNLLLHADAAAQLTADKITLEASHTLELRVGNSSIVLSPGSIEIKSPMITSAAVGEHLISGALIRIN